MRMEHEGNVRSVVVEGMGVVRLIFFSAVFFWEGFEGGCFGNLGDGQANQQHLDLWPSSPDQLSPVQLQGRTLTWPAQGMHQQYLTACLKPRQRMKLKSPTLNHPLLH